MRRALLAMVVGLLAGCRRDALPPRMTIEQVVAEVAPPLAPGASVEGVPASAVVRTLLQPGYTGGCGGTRDAVAVPPGTAIRVHLDVPPDGVLRFSVGVDGDKQRHPDLSGTEFRVTVDGETAFTRVVNPAARRQDRCWVDGAVDLRAWAGRGVDVVLEARADHPERSLAGTAGWSRVRLVSQKQRDRQLVDAGPNVLLLLVDTLRADQLGVYGANPSPTPALDRFAARGTVFDLAVGQASWTMPAVASIFTGLHPRSHGAVKSAANEGRGKDSSGTLLPDSVVTIAETAQETGVTTVGISTNLIVSRASNLAQGFETFLELPFDKTTRDFVRAGVVNRRFLDWTRRESHLRFFAYLHYMEPHAPYAPPQELRPEPPAGVPADVAAGRSQEFALAVNEHRIGLPDAPVVSYLRSLYAGDIRTWDDDFGALIQQLEADGILERTIVVVMADHGEEFLEHGNLSHGNHLYEETVHIPLIMVGPGIPVGRRTDMAQGIDLLPTIASILGAPVPAGLSGRDLLTTDTAGDVVSEIDGGFGDDHQGITVALRTPRLKLIRLPGGENELYDLANDPGEHTNLAATSDQTAALSARLDRWAANAPPPPQAAGSDPMLGAKLRRLGYVE